MKMMADITDPFFCVCKDSMIEFHRPSLLDFNFFLHSKKKSLHDTNQPTEYIVQLKNSKRPSSFCIIAVHVIQYFHILSITEI